MERSPHGKTSSIRPVVSMQYRLVTDRQTDTYTTTTNTALAQRRAVKMDNIRCPDKKSELYSHSICCIFDAFTILNFSLTQWLCVNCLM